ncbi:sarcosine oxidase subunit gamma [Paracoccus sp. p4-l81]|uniref:sarcosine oxidase subunit gamma n=1 Tax=unclassified Paracoccus (in: a-proteobacteria) TaxID=2688777 RepID=UPI0035B9D98A
MSDRNEPLARIDGPLADAPAMIGLRGDLSDPRIVTGITAATGCDMPAPRGIVEAGARSLGWMSPDELILMLPAADLADVLDALADALAGLHHLVVDVSDMRAMFQITGPRADQVLMKLTPADVAGVAVGELRRSRVAQVAAAFWRVDGGWRLVCFRSVAVYMRDLLDTAAQPGGDLDPQ